jgi:hypothetical protein
LSLLLPVFVPSHASGSTRLRLAPMDLMSATKRVLWLMARGFQQEQGRDYDETFAPVAHMTTMRTLLAVASARHWSVSQHDVQNAFLNGELHDEVYMQPPPGYSVPNGMICHLRRSLYGLKQAPRAWFERFASVGQLPVSPPALMIPRCLFTLLLEDGPFSSSMLMI